MFQELEYEVVEPLREYEEGTVSFLTGREAGKGRRDSRGRSYEGGKLPSRRLRARRATASSGRRRIGDRLYLIGSLYQQRPSSKEEEVKKNEKPDAPSPSNTHSSSNPSNNTPPCSSPVPADFSNLDSVKSINVALIPDASAVRSSFEPAATKRELTAEDEEGSREYRPPLLMPPETEREEKRLWSLGVREGR